MPENSQIQDGYHARNIDHARVKHTWEN